VLSRAAGGLGLHLVGSLKMNTALEYSTRVVQEGDRRCKKSTLNDLAYLTPLRIPLMNPVTVCSATCRPATLPLIKPNGSESHHHFWISAGPAHLRCGSGKEWSNVRGQLFIQKNLKAVQ
jgi:hypothetical protein